MKRVSKADWHKVTGISAEALKRLHHRDQIAIAFGGSRVYESTSLFAADCVVPLIAETLGQASDLTFAAQIVRVYADAVAAAIAHADHDTGRDYSLCVVDLARLTDNAPAHAVYVANSAGSPINLDAYSEAEARAQGFEAIRTTCVNVSRLMRFVRQTAARHGLDLLDPLLPEPNSSAFLELLRPLTERRENAIVRLAEMRRAVAQAEKVGAAVRERATTPH